MASRMKSWRDRLEQSREPEVKRLSSPFAGLVPGTQMLVSSPREVNEWIRAIPYGKTHTVEHLKQNLVRRHGAEAACPASIMIFLRVVAEAAWEELEDGAEVDQVTPFWRVIEPDSKIARKLSCGAQFIREQRDREAF